MLGLPRPANQNELVAIDLEILGMDSNRLHRPEGTFGIMTMAYNKKEVYTITDVHDVRECLARLKKGHWVFHNAVFDLRQLRRWADVPRRPIHDTLLFDKNLFSGYYETFSLDDCVRRWFSEYMDKSVRDEFEKTTKIEKHHIKYAENDAKWTVSLAKEQLEYAKESGEAMLSYYDVDSPMIWVVLSMLPMKVDVAAWLKLNEENQQMATKLEQELGFNVKSVQQCKKAIKELTGKTIKSTGADVLEEFKHTLVKPKHRELIDAILQARRYRDMVSKYGDKWLTQNVEEGQLVYPSWNITGAETGRMSCSNPNMQQIPRQEFPVYRTFFVSNNGKLIVADVSQQEPSILAYLSKDPTLGEIIKSGKSSHVEVGKRIIDPDMSKKHPRYHEAKTVNLGMSYGLSGYGLAKQLHISEREADDMVMNYFAAFPGVAMYMDKQRAMGARLGFVRTSMDRKIYLNPYSKQVDNNSVNAPIQGSAADETKLAAVNLMDRCFLEGVEFPLCGIIHDEVVLDIEAGETKRYQGILKESWGAAADRVTPGFPCIIEAFVGQNWGVKT